MSSPNSDVYSGSRMFQFLSDAIGLPIDQVNFVLAQTFGLLFGILYRRLLPPDSVSPVIRQITSMIPGLLMGYFCSGYQIYHLFLLATLCYASILALKPSEVHRVILVIALAHLSYLHLLRVVYDYGRYTIDITGPIMIAVQKVINAGFSIHDGMARNYDDLTDEQKRYSIRQKPSFLEFYSYIFHFQTLLSGPLVFYNDYIEFTDGTNIKKHHSKNGLIKLNPFNPAIKKLFTSITFAVLLITVAPKFPITYLKEEKFLNSSFLSKCIYIYCTTWVARFKYYYAWIIGEVISNVSGLGFAGYDPKTGQQNWELMSNIDIWKFENAPNFRDALIYWNKTTQNWLRRIAYERSRHYRLLVTYVLSAFWHGFYPGYYLTFLGGAFFTLAARNARRCIRPMFQSNAQLRLIYDVLTYITTRVIMAYLIFPFILLELAPSFAVYAKLYFFGHILGLIGIFIVPKVFPPPKIKHKSS